MHDHVRSARNDDVPKRLTGDIGADRLDRTGDAAQPPRVARVGADVHVHHVFASAGGPSYELGPDEPQAAGHKEPRSHDGNEYIDRIRVGNDCQRRFIDAAEPVLRWFR